MPSVVRDETNKETLKDKNLQRERQINNRDPYKGREPEVGGLTYPVIFEPIQNVEFSRFVYKVTSMVDFNPYVEYFRKYEPYLTKLYKDIRKEKVKIITNQFRLLKERNYTSYLPSHLDSIDCDRPKVCEENPSRDCYHWYVSICMSQKHYKQLLKETRHVKEVFDTLKGSFYEAINHREEELIGDDQENKRMTRSLIEYEGMNLEESRRLEEALTVLKMFRDDETTDYKTRQRRFVAELGSFLAGIGAYVNY